MILGVVMLHLFVPCAPAVAFIAAAVVGAVVGVSICCITTKFGKDQSISTILDDSTTMVLSGKEL